MEISYLYKKNLNNEENNLKGYIEFLEVLYSVQ